MGKLSLHQFHAGLGARFTELKGEEAVSNYGQPLAEHSVLRETVGVLDLSFRGRLCVTGADRQRFLHGQVTNDVNILKVGEGCYAALITAKGKMISDLNVYRLENELLLDFEPGLSQSVAQRLEQYIIADDVQVVEVGLQYGLWTIQGPRAADLLQTLSLSIETPAKPLSFACVQTEHWGEVYLVNQPRLGAPGFDLYVPSAAMQEIGQRLQKASASVGGRFCGWDAFEIVRIEAGLPRFGADMDESNLPPEAGLDERAISYSKGCYIGQEVIARIRTYGQVAKALRGLRLSDDLPALPVKGDLLFKEGKEVGFVTSAVASPAFHRNLALGYVRREANALGAELMLRTSVGETPVRIIGLPFGQNWA